MAWGLTVVWRLPEVDLARVWELFINTLCLPEP